MTVLLGEQTVHKNADGLFYLEQWHHNGLVRMEILTSETSSSLSAMPVGPHNFTEKQVSHADSVVVSNERNLFQDFTLKIGEDVLPKLDFSTRKPD